ncbi:hypothetical protein LL912_00815 [Niabella sp. CC-SYL272]|uniref:hypothetical protein n=1 Tax=Niabella agricola TaxID=2891571 RepID=UPI001F2D9587|nr:hypothetical protein [Niabella agricola]MCF3107308.1 hypothetical protein [Niabella agricola]
MSGKKIHKQEAGGKVLFKPGNQAAVKWTDETVIPEIEKVLAVLCNDDSGLENQNIVRANDIKYVEEAVLAAGVDLRSWEYWNSGPFVAKLPDDSLVLGLLKKVKKISELRCLYSGQAMDIFFLKNKFDYRDKSEQEIKQETTLKGSIAPEQWLKGMMKDDKDSGAI